MQRTAALLYACHAVQQHFVFKQCAFVAGFGNARQLLVNNASRADVQMPDFAVAHLPFRQANRIAGRL